MADKVSDKVRDKVRGRGFAEGKPLYNLYSEAMSIPLEVQPGLATVRFRLFPPCAPEPLPIHTGTPP